MTATETSKLASVMAEVAKSTENLHSAEDALNSLVRAAKETVPGVHYASITVKHPDGRYDTVAATDDESVAADLLQYEYDEGPCVDAAGGYTLLNAIDLTSDPRWPRYGPDAAARFGVRSQLAYTMFADQQTFGGLNLYSKSAGVFDENALLLAEMFATQGAVAMGHARTFSQLQDALATRTVIGQATGLIMERYELDEGRAFAFLTRMSQTGNIKLRDVAEEVVSSANEKMRSKGDS